MRRRHLWLITVSVVVLVAVLVLASCGGSSTSTTAAPAGSTTTPDGATTTAEVSVDAAALFSQNCAGCHKNVPSGSADRVRSLIEAGNGKKMPAFKDKLTAAQIAALAAWVANGGK